MIVRVSDDNDNSVYLSSVADIKIIDPLPYRIAIFVGNRAGLDVHELPPITYKIETKARDPRQNSIFQVWQQSVLTNTTHIPTFEEAFDRIQEALPHNKDFIFRIVEE